LAYVPPDCDVYSQSHHGGEYLKIVIPPGQAAARFRDRRFSDAVDPIAIRAAQNLRASCWQVILSIQSPSSTGSIR
jgi:AraC family transcriptional regulator